jgi:menaquinone-dependent protoporphyrinogen oxidase
MPDKILVTYASRTGSTAGIAEAIGAALTENGEQVEVLPMEQVDDLTPYRAVVAGSAIRGGQWLPEAMEFVERNQRTLKRIPFAPFLVCITMSMENEKAREGVRSWLQPVRNLVKPVAEGYFAGTLNPALLPKLSFSTLGLRIALALGIWKPGDHRDWITIRAWAKGLPAKFAVANA